MMWKDEYRELLFPVKSTDVKLGRAMEVKYQNIPSSLFKYRNVSSFSKDNLINDTVRLTKATEFNDPYDCALQVNQEKAMYEGLKESAFEKVSEIFNKHGMNYEVNNEEKQSLLGQSYREVLTFIFSKMPKLNGDSEKIEKFVTQILANLSAQHEEYSKSVIGQFQEGTFISCFSEDVNSILMWSHYAYNHKGFCIEYDFTKLEVNDPLTQCLYPVNYTNELFDIADYVIQGENVNKLFSTYSAITKSKEWIYEKEWRLVFTLGQKVESFNKKMVKPTAIYLGAKISEEDRESVINIARSKRLRVF